MGWEHKYVQSNTSSFLQHNNGYQTPNLGQAIIYLDICVLIVNGPYRFIND